MTSAVSQDSSAAFEDAIGRAFEAVAETLASAMAGAEVSLVGTNVASQSPDEVIEHLDAPVVRAVVFIEGAVPETAVLLCLSVDDAKIAVNIMSGGTGESVAEEFDDLHQSASGELLKDVSQALAEHLSVAAGSRVQAKPENVSVLALASERDELEAMGDSRPLTVVTASYTCGAPVISLQLIAPAQFVEAIASMAEPAEAPKAVEEPAGGETPEPGRAPEKAAAALLTAEEIEAVLGGPPEEVAPEVVAPAAPEPAAPRTAAAPPGMPEARPVQYEDLGTDQRRPLGLDNLELIKNIPVQLSVELGRTQRTLGEILEFGAGSTIQLDKAADEPVDILAGGRYIATGEVVVVDDNFAVRIRQILKPLHRRDREEGP